MMALTGRLARKPYLIAFLVSAMLAGGVAIATGSAGDGGFVLYICSTLFVPGRLRDMNRNPRWGMLFVPLAILTLTIEVIMRGDLQTSYVIGGIALLACAGVLAVIPGTPGPNRYGREPGDAEEKRVSDLFS